MISMLAEPLQRLVDIAVGAGLATAKASDEAACIAASVCRGQADAEARWRVAFDRTDLADRAGVASAWERGPTPVLRELLTRVDRPIAVAYASALADVAPVAASFANEPTLDAITRAGFIAAAQRRAAAPQPGEASSAPVWAGPLESPVVTQVGEKGGV